VNFSKSIYTSVETLRSLSENAIAGRENMMSSLPLMLSLLTLVAIIYIFYLNTRMQKTLREQRIDIDTIAALIDTDLSPGLDTHREQHIRMSHRLCEPEEEPEEIESDQEEIASAMLTRMFPESDEEEIDAP
jgi:hypothetical protein